MNTLHPDLASAQRIALYARVSSEEQAERGTVEAQRDFLKNYASLYALDVIDEYVDDGYSGTIPLGDRPEGRRLLEDAKERRFDVVVVYRIDRLGRSLRALLEAHAELERAGVMIRSATEPLDTSSPMGRFVFQLLGSLAELERNTIQERTSLGRDRSARSGKFTGGTIPFGYDVDDEQHLVLSDRVVDGVGLTEAEVARSVFERMAGGATSTGECRRLNALGVATISRYGGGQVRTKGSPWMPSRLTFMLKNPVYVGSRTLNSRFGAIQHDVPPLIDHATWERAKAQLAANRHLPKPNSTRKYLLRGLVTCSTCGVKFVGSPGHGANGWQSYYYRCTSQIGMVPRNNRRRCNAKNLPALWLEDLIWRDCAEFSRNPGPPLAEAQRQLRERLTQTAKLQGEEKGLARLLAGKDEERERVMTLFRRGRATLDDTERQLDAIEGESSGLRTQLAVIHSQADLAQTFEAQFADAASLLGRLRDRVDEIERTNDEAGKRQVIELLVAGISVDTHGEGRAKTACVHVNYNFGQSHVVDSKTGCAGRICERCPARAGAGLGATSEVCETSYD